jgi:hypothetical protein
MRVALAVVCALALVLSVVGCGGSGTEESGSSTAADTPVVTEVEETAPPSNEPSISELEFSIEGYNYEGVTDAEGLKPGGGAIGRLLCEGHEIELASHEFARGLIVTKDYGELKIRFSPTMTEEAFAIWTTPEQEQALAQLAGKAE